MKYLGFHHIGFVEDLPQISTGGSLIAGYQDTGASAQEISLWDIALAGFVLIHDLENQGNG